MSNTRPRRDLAAWAHELAQNQMPVFARTAQSVVSKAADAESSAAELAKQILQDASMTARLLRMANSSYFNPSGGKINTVSRAIIVLGFDVVRDICLSIALIDTLSSATDRGSVVKEMAMSFHAAVQAKSLAELSKQKDPEEIFIATLLYRLGRLAFWSCAGRVDPELVGRLHEALKSNPGKSEEAERDVLGFRIADLTLTLNREWRLSTLLAQTLDPGAQATTRSLTVGFGHEIAQALQSGRDSELMQRVLRKVSKSLGISVENLVGRLEANARAAAETVQGLGAADAAALIPSAAERAPSETPAIGPPVAASAAAVPLAGDQQLQLDILRDIALLLGDTKANVNALMEMVLEGIFRGVGMDHAVFALITPDKTQLRAKFVLGNGRETLQAEFLFPLGPSETHPIARSLKTGEAQWIGGPGHPASTDSRLRKLCGGECFLLPLSLSGIPIGCIYADRARAESTLTAEAFDQFKLFGQQARMGLAFLKAR